jgi:hypothetical protein
MARMAALAVLMASVVVSGCAPMYGRPMFGPVSGASRAHRVPYEPPPIGRWDAVMSLAPDSVIEVLAADGTTHIAQFVKASLASIALVENGAPAALPRAEVVRVTLLPGVRTADGVQNAAAGAAKGAAAAGVGIALVPYLMTGHVWVPPARFWGTGAVLGAADAITRQRDSRRPRTVYIAPLDGM